MSNEGKKNKNKNDKKDTDDLSIKCKVVLIGKSTVGKTSIILRYTSNTYRETLRNSLLRNFDEIISFSKLFSYLCNQKCNYGNYEQLLLVDLHTHYFITDFMLQLL